MKTKEWLILNAVECWLHYYSKPHSPTVEQYKELCEEYKALLNAPKEKPKPTRKPRSKSTDDSSPTTKTV